MQHEFFWPITVKMKCGHMADPQCVMFVRSAMINMDLPIEDKHKAMIEGLEGRDCTSCVSISNANH